MLSAVALHAGDGAGGADAVGQHVRAAWTGSSVLLALALLVVLIVPAGRSDRREVTSVERPHMGVPA